MCILLADAYRLAVGKDNIRAAYELEQQLRVLVEAHTIGFVSLCAPLHFECVAFAYAVYASNSNRNVAVLFAVVCVYRFHLLVDYAYP